MTTNPLDIDFWRAVLARHEALALDSVTDRETLACALAEAAQAEAGIPLTDWTHAVRGLDRLRVTTERLQGERDNWRETAAQETRNTMYLRGLLDLIGSQCAPEAYVADDGSVQGSPLHAKLPALVERLRAERDEWRWRAGALLRDEAKADGT